MLITEYPSVPSGEIMTVTRSPRSKPVARRRFRPVLLAYVGLMWALYHSNS